MAGPSQRVRALRGFRHKGQVIGPGSVLDLDRSQAIELKTVNKVEFVQPETKPVQTDVLPKPVLGRKAPESKPAKKE